MSGRRASCARWRWLCERGDVRSLPTAVLSVLKLKDDSRSETAEGQSVASLEKISVARKNPELFDEQNIKVREGSELVRSEEAHVDENEGVDGIAAGDLRICEYLFSSETKLQSLQVEEEAAKGKTEVSTKATSSTSRSRLTNDTDASCRHRYVVVRKRPFVTSSRGECRWERSRGGGRCRGRSSRRRRRRSKGR